MIYSVTIRVKESGKELITYSNLIEAESQQTARQEVREMYLLPQKQPVKVRRIS